MVCFCLLLSFSLLLLSVWCESNSAHTVTVVYFSLLLLAVWCGSNSAHTGAVVYSRLRLSFSLLLLSVWCESNSAHTVAVVYFSLLLLAVWCGSNSVHTGAVVYSRLRLSFSLLLLTVWCESNSAHTVAVVYFSLQLLAVWCGSNSVHTGAVVYSCLWLSFSLLLLAVWCESNSAHTVAMVYFSLLLLAVWCGSNSVHTGAVVYSCYLLSFLELSLAGYDVGVRNELLLAVGAFYLFSYRTEGLRIDGNSCPCLLSSPAPAPHSKCLGQSFARFKRPFESRPGVSGTIIWSCNLATRALFPQRLRQPRLLVSWIRQKDPPSAHRRGFTCRRRLEFWNTRFIWRALRRRIVLWQAIMRYFCVNVFIFQKRTQYIITLVAISLISVSVTV